MKITENAMKAMAEALRKKPPEALKKARAGVNKETRPEKVAAV